MIDCNTPLPRRLRRQRSFASRNGSVQRIAGALEAFERGVDEFRDVFIVTVRSSNSDGLHVEVGGSDQLL
jgi:hypothetical protein